MSSPGHRTISHRKRPAPGADVLFPSLGERGSTLVLALAFTTIIMSITVALLAFANAGTTAVHSYKFDRNRRYGVDGALQTAVQMVSKDSTLGVTGGTNSCEMRFLVREGTEVKGPNVVAGGTYLLADCAPTSTSLTGGASSGTGAIQEARDVTFTIKCNTTPSGTPTSAVPFASLTCGSGTTQKVLARARVRFEPDYTMTSATAAPKRAVIPKIISWEVRA